MFQAFSRIIREAGEKFVVMDTAPTGHTLLLLDATGAYHREVARMLDAKGAHYTTPMMQLQDPKQTKVLLVTLAETTPVLEAAESSGRFAPRGDRAMGVGHQQQRRRGAPEFSSCCANARRMKFAKSTP